MGSDLILYQFSRSKVERVDFSHFLSLYSPDHLPTGRRLRVMMDSMVFAIEGWDDDSREIHTIPEIRRFYNAFHQAWPYWLYFCNLESDVLRAMLACCLTSLTTIQVDGQIKVGVQPDPLELLQFLSRDFVPMNELCERAELFEQRIYERTKRVFEYFSLPFDAAPPA